MLRVYATFSDAGLGGSKIVAAEGFFNRTTPPALGPDNGTGFVFMANDGAFDSPTERAYGLVPLTELTALPDGPVSIYIHAKDAAGNWGADLGGHAPGGQDEAVGLRPHRHPAGRRRRDGSSSSSPLGNPGTSPSNVVAAEYFLGTVDPGAGNGTAVPGLTFPLARGNGHGHAAEPAPRRPDDRRPGQGPAGNWSTPVSASITVLTEPIFSDTFGTVVLRDPGQLHRLGRPDHGNRAIRWSPG